MNLQLKNYKLVEKTPLHNRHVGYLDSYTDTGKILLNLLRMAPRLGDWITLLTLPGPCSPVP